MPKSVVISDVSFLFNDIKILYILSNCSWYRVLVSPLFFFSFVVVVVVIIIS